ncbi:MAG: FtsX-like permease family protein [Candidatus Thermoplasmatota archaeon]|nr:FtsX-like permease family protein [Candidatus Thermoplasmatota archaeon]
MIPTLVSKSFRDITRKKARSFFLMATIALGVVGLSLTAVVPLGDRAVYDKIEQENMHNLKIRFEAVPLNATVLKGLGDLENVLDVEPRIEYGCKMFIGERRNWALFVGVDDLSDQKVDRIVLSSGEMPIDGEVLADEANAMNGVYAGSRGDDFEVIRHDMSHGTVHISGKGKNLIAAGETMEGVAVFYANTATVRNISGFDGFNSLAFTMERTDKTSMDSTIEAIRVYLEVNLPVVAFSDLPEVRPEGYYEGQETLEQFGDFFMIFAVLILVCSIILIANTMNTMIAEQTREVAQMKAIGATRFDIFRSFLQTSFVLGLIGSVIGALLGIYMAYIVLIQFAKPFGFHPGFYVHLETVALSMVVGTFIAIVACVPALVKAVRVDILKALSNKGIESGTGAKLIEKPLMGIKVIPRLARMGVRNVNRKMGRSLATVLQISMSVAVIIALTFLGSSIFDAVQGNWKDQRWDLQVFFDRGPEDPINLTYGTELIGTIPGVKEIEPFIMTDGTLSGRSGLVYGMVQDPWSLDYSITLLRKGEGRWWTTEEESQGASVVIVGYAMAQFTGVGLGDMIDLTTATGVRSFEVIGIDDTNWDDGLNFRMPITTLQRTLEVENAIGGFYIRTSSDDHADIDRTAENIWKVLEDKGMNPSMGTNYILEEEDRTSNEIVLNLLFTIGSVIVFISLLGLASTLTMNILDRTKEIGMLRCIGARSSSIAAVFAIEGAFLAKVGWLFGVPLGLGLYALLLSMVRDVMKISLQWDFSVTYVLISLVITVVGTVVVMLMPVMRAVRFRPGEALRYE